MSDKNFELWPAIDIIDGKPVRLLKGDYSQKTEYNHTFESLAETFSQFAYGIHVIDLDGAKKGSPVNIQAIRKIIQHSGDAIVEVGGGIRSMKDIEQLFTLGVSRCILGTSALKDPQFLAEALQQYGAEKIVVGVDCKNRKVATHGWETESTVTDIEFITQLETAGVKIINYTDIATDGMLQGSATDVFAELHKHFPRIRFIGSGGIATLQDIEDVQKTGISGIIFGKAFYEKRITTTDLQIFIAKHGSTTQNSSA